MNDSQSRGNSPTRLSVVLVVPNTRETALRTIQHLQRQTAVRQIELVVFAPAQEVLDSLRNDLSAFGASQAILWRNSRNLAKARAEGVRAARSAIVAHAEDHCFPEPEWAERLIDAHKEPHAAVGPLMINANPASLWSWAAFTLHFGHCAFPETRGTVAYVATHNTSFKKQALLDLGADLERLTEMELLLQDRLKRDGHSIYHEAGARTHHVNVSQPLASLTASFYGGWLFSTTRVREENWTLGRKLFQLAASPLVPWLQLKRRWQALRSISDETRLLPGIAIPVLLIAALHTCGEVVGILFPNDHVIESYSNFENTRIRFVRPAERHLLTPLPSGAPAESDVARSAGPF